MIDKKRDYLIKTLSRTKRKDYETYIIGAIWHRIGNLNLQPVTQQYVKRSDGKYALLDLYFPQLNLGIECDEEYHIINQSNDIKRELTMEEMLDSFEETENFTLRRVKAYESIDLIDAAIEDIVSDIKARIDDIGYLFWDIDKKASDIILEKKSICIHDKVRFDSIIEIAKCFGKNYKGMQRSYFMINDKILLWCPKLATIQDNGEHIAATKYGWVNYLSDDWTVIYESNTNISSLKKDRYYSIPRVTFAQSKDVLGRTSYRFLGIYKLDEEASSNNEMIYKRIETKLQIT